ncbi:unnamed protein product [Polarella glacialis]|uniref:Uncharacterized protein n=1 Tax=Polarella glacialis TaxID=89957 RepID=A0A813KZS4_POLGL|nr:unnamed protein product [Polarella glacialis]CAE8717299.1 unnamed protein product [Polarella glacialis]
MLPLPDLCVLQTPNTVPDRLERVSCTLQNQRVCSFSIDDEDINLGQGPLFHQAANSADQNWSGGSASALIHTSGLLPRSAIWKIDCKTWRLFVRNGSMDHV